MSERIEFKNTGEDFSASHQLERWCEENDFAIGSMERDSPQGLRRGRDKWCVAKWRNLSTQDRNELDGVVEWSYGGPRIGHCVVTIRTKAEAP